MSPLPGPSTGGDEQAQYEPANGGDRVTLAVLRSEVVHGFRYMDGRLTKIEDSQADCTTRLEVVERAVAVLDATAIKAGAVRLGLVVGGAVTIVLGLATVITKVAGLW